MALKSKLTKAEFDALPDVLKEHYKASGDSYLLDSDDAAELRRAKEREVEQTRLEKERADRLQAELDAEKEAKRVAAEEAAKKAKDIPAIEASWASKVEAAKAEAQRAVDALKTKLNNLLVKSKAEALANKISTAPSLLAPVIAARLQAETDGDEAKTRVLDATGKVSAMTLEDLEKEIVANAEYAAIIRGTNANGGGAGSGGSGGGAGKAFKDMSEAERVALYRSNPTEFKRLAGTH